MFFSYLKAKNEEIQKNYLVAFSFIQVKNRFAHFGKIKKIRKNFSLMYKEGFCSFPNKILIFKGPVFFKSETFIARAAKFADFFNWTNKNIGSQSTAMCSFSKIAKNENHSTLTCNHTNKCYSNLSLKSAIARTRILTAPNFVRAL